MPRFSMGALLLLKLHVHAALAKQPESAPHSDGGLQLRLCPERGQWLVLCRGDRRPEECALTFPALNTATLNCMQSCMAVVSAGFWKRTLLTALLAGAGRGLTPWWCRSIRGPWPVQEEKFDRSHLHQSAGQL